MFSSSLCVLSFQIPIFISSPCNHSKALKFHLDVSIALSGPTQHLAHERLPPSTSRTNMHWKLQLEWKRGGAWSLEWWDGVGNGWEDEASVNAELGCHWVWLERAHQREESLLSVDLGRNKGTWSLEVKLFTSDLAAMPRKLQRVIDSRQLTMWNGSLEKFLIDECLVSRSEVAGGLFKCYWEQMGGLFVKAICPTGRTAWVFL